MTAKRTSKKRQDNDFYQELGEPEFTCEVCKHKFSIDWESILAIQECTHGYVGFYIHPTDVICPNCERAVGEQQSDSHVPFNGKPTDDQNNKEQDLPF